MLFWALPPVSYLEHEAAVEGNKSALAFVKEEISYLSGIKNLNPIVLEYEQAKLKQLKQEDTAVVRF